MKLHILILLLAITTTSIFGQGNGDDEKQQTADSGFSPSDGKDSQSKDDKLPPNDSKRPADTDRPEDKDQSVDKDRPVDTMSKNGIDSPLIPLPNSNSFHADGSHSSSSSSSEKHEQEQKQNEESHWNLDQQSHGDGSTRPTVLTTLPPVLTTRPPVLTTRPPVLTTLNPDKTNFVHISGNILLKKLQQSSIASVQYEQYGWNSQSGSLLHPSLIQSTQNFDITREIIARGSQITLYVSTTKTLEPKQAFDKFEIEWSNKYFPVPFDIDVRLPYDHRVSEQKSDIVLYFFVYIVNENNAETFIPAGSSQILLQNTNLLSQRLDIFVQMSGIRINGLIKVRFSPSDITPGTTFHIKVVPENSWLPSFRQSQDVSVAELTITNPTTKYPVAFLMTVSYQSLKLGVKYYAIGYINENGQQRLIQQEPIWIINEQQILVTPQLVFTVIPNPFILSGVVQRSMPRPSNYRLQPHSSLIIRVHEIGSKTPDIIYKLPDINILPQNFQINISEAYRFDQTRNYDIRALILSERNDLYMASLEPVSLLVDVPMYSPRIYVPVDDLLYFVKCLIVTSSTHQLRFMRGSSAKIFVTDSPETSTKPIASLIIRDIESFRNFTIRIPATAIEQGHNYYLVVRIELNDMVTHLSKTLVISQNQPPPLVIELPIISLNLISGTIYDLDVRPAQWSSSSHVELYLIDSSRPKQIVQIWRVHLEKDFPVRFEVELDFSLLFPDRIYQLQAAIKNQRDELEYQPAGTIDVLNRNGIITDIRIPVTIVKKVQVVNGLVYIVDLQKITISPPHESSELIIQLSSTPSLQFPTIIQEQRIDISGKELPIGFSMKLDLAKIDITSVYYFLVRYVRNGRDVIPVQQAFAFSPRNEATVVITLSKTPQIPIRGQVVSSTGTLMLPLESVIHLYITDQPDLLKPVILSEVYLQTTLNRLYEFEMTVDSILIQQQRPLYLRAEILYREKIVLRMPRAALLQLSAGGEWNVNLIVDLPTILTGEITSLRPIDAIHGDFDVYVIIFERGQRQTVLQQIQIRLDAKLPQSYRIEVDQKLFSSYKQYQAEAIIKNCKEQTLFESGGSVDITKGLNVNIVLPVILTDPAKLNNTVRLDEVAPVDTGDWKLSVTGNGNFGQIEILPFAYQGSNFAYSGNAGSLTQLQQVAVGQQGLVAGVDRKPDRVVDSGFGALPSQRPEGDYHLSQGGSKSSSSSSLSKEEKQRQESAQEHWNESANGIGNRPVVETIPPRRT
ncbi:unnamed protein product [Didymodactylos carnosus]|uniref:Uncharacterized protein n=1 Tax=Didymodactylos carnosus TaxID=1234261 RepID=A0A8S2ITP2_9BILA|nr:unnamed protein product [Didymodactylos carnosus]CAF3757458.1 unnamed protein product [Didymodactylos carnosus]